MLHRSCASRYLKVHAPPRPGLAALPKLARKDPFGQTSGSCFRSPWCLWRAFVRPTSVARRPRGLSLSGKSRPVLLHINFLIPSHGLSSPLTARTKSRSVSLRITETGKNRGCTDFARKQARWVLFTAATPLHIPRAKGAAFETGEGRENPRSELPKARDQERGWTAAAASERAA